MKGLWVGIHKSQTQNPKSQGNPKPKIPKVLGKFVLFETLLLAAGCISTRDLYVLGPNPANPFPDIKRVVVLPFSNLTASRLDPVAVANLFASECASFPGFDVVWPTEAQHVMAANGWTIESPEDAVRIGREMKADGVFFGLVTEHDPYDPPTATITLYLFATNLVRPTGRAQIWSMSDRASPALLPGSRGHDKVAAAVQQVYSARTVSVEKKLRAWARQRDREVDLGWEHFKRVNDEYMRFCSNMLLRELCDLAAPPPAPKPL